MTPNSTAAYVQSAARTALCIHRERVEIRSGVDDAVYSVVNNKREERQHELYCQNTMNSHVFPADAPRLLWHVALTEYGYPADVWHNLAI